MTRNPEIRFAKSIVDYIFRWMASKFMSPEAQFHAGVNGRELDDHGHVPARACGSGSGSGRSGSESTSRNGDAVLNHPEPGRCTAVLDLRLDHDPQRRLLQVRQLRKHQRLRVNAVTSDPASRWL